MLSTGGSAEGQTHDAASHKTVSPTRYPLSYSGPYVQMISNKSVFFQKLCGCSLDV